MSLYCISLYALYGGFPVKFTDKQEYFLLDLAVTNEHFCFDISGHYSQCTIMSLYSLLHYTQCTRMPLYCLNSTVHCMLARLDFQCTRMFTAPQIDWLPCTLLIAFLILTPHILSKIFSRPNN